MSKFAEGINLKNAKAITKKEIYFLSIFTSFSYSLPSMSCPDLELLAVTVFEISSFLCQKFAKGNNSKNVYFFFLIFHQVVYSLSSIS